MSNNGVFKWKRRSDEWIKANPGKGTMYKANPDGTEYDPDVRVEMKVEKKEKRVVPVLKDVDYGIYVIICEKAKYAYVGQSTNVSSRLRSHKMMIKRQSLTSKNKTYFKMQEHVDRYGMDSFVFDKYMAMPGATIDELLSKESEVMGEFVRNGYNLYNTAINLDVLGEVIVCPRDFQSVVSAVIDRLASETDFIRKLNDILR